ncbi:MAG: DUF6484 domain-containing protein [Steroidobacteraceae bacterium]
MSADPRKTMTPELSVDDGPGSGCGELGSLLRAPSSRTRAAGAAGATDTLGATSAAGAAAVLGRIVEVDGAGAVGVEIPGVPGARAARLAVSLSRDELLAARQTRRSVVLVFENGDPALPIIVGLLQAAGPAPAARPAGSARDPGSQGPRVLEADVDGKRVRITAQDEIVLECGSASITLRRNGRVVVRGTYVESYSDGTNRIKGGQVRIN